jgi:hypothetical protein
MPIMNESLKCSQTCGPDANCTIIMDIRLLSFAYMTSQCIRPQSIVNATDNGFASGVAFLEKKTT